MTYRASTAPGKTVAVEVWPIAVDTRDHTGLWLLDRKQWRLGPVPGDVAEWDAVLEIMRDHAARPAVVHQTSTRDEGTEAVHTFVACVELDDAGLEVWPLAQPIVTGKLLDVAGRPTVVGATEAPVPRHLDVLMHGVRHLALLAHGVLVGVHRLGLDEAIRDSMSPEWLAWLEPIEPALATLYAPRRVTAA